jgi:hypothetical protein
MVALWIRSCMGDRLYRNGGKERARVCFQVVVVIIVICQGFFSCEESKSSSLGELLTIWIDGSAPPPSRPLIPWGAGSFIS